MASLKTSLKNKTVKPNATPNTASAIMNTEANTLPAPSAPVVADGTSPEVKAPEVEPEAAPEVEPEVEPVNDEDEDHDENNDKVEPWHIRRFVDVDLGAAPKTDTGFATLLGRALDITLSRTRDDERGALFCATVRAAYKAWLPLLVVPNDTDASTIGARSITARERDTFERLLYTCVENKTAGKVDRTLARVGRRIHAAEKAIKSAVKTCKMRESDVRLAGSQVADRVNDVERRAAYMRNFKA